THYDISAQASSPGVPGKRLGNHSDLLTSIVVDSPYSGKTGNKSVEHLCQTSGLRTRLGLADNIQLIVHGQARGVQPHKGCRQ
ncbi:MAG: hypothetical protein ACKPKO_65580, partial [Candidatus Fonsibacter sp.]